MERVTMRFDIDINKFYKNAIKNSREGVKTQEEKYNYIYLKDQGKINIINAFFFIKLFLRRFLKSQDKNNNGQVLR